MKQQARLIYIQLNSSKFGTDWQQKFADYYATAMKIKALGGDDLDHALIAALPRDLHYILKQHIKSKIKTV